MEYGKLVSRSFEIAWQHKWLWIFGMFAAGMAFNLKIEYLLGISPTDFFALIKFAMENPEQMNAANSTIYPISFLTMLMVIFSSGAIIDSVNRIERGGTFSFSTAFSAGVENFFKLLGLSIVFFVIGFALSFIIILVAGIILAINQILGFLVFLFVIPLSLFIFFIVFQICTLSYRVAVIRKTGLIDSINEGYMLLKIHFGKNLLIFLILIAISISFGIFAFIMWWIVNIPIHLMIQAIDLKSFVAMLTAIILGLPISYIVGGVFGIFSTTFYTLFYIELVEPKVQEMFVPQTIATEADNNKPLDDNPPKI